MTRLALLLTLPLVACATPRQRANADFLHAYQDAMADGTITADEQGRLDALKAEIDSMGEEAEGWEETLWLLAGVAGAALLGAGGTKAVQGVRAAVKAKQSA
jgi:hypothetical protein